MSSIRKPQVIILTLVVGILAVSGVLMLPYERHGSVARRPNSDPRVSLTLSSTQLPEDLKNHEVRCCLKNLSDKPLSVLAGRTADFVKGFELPEIPIDCCIDPNYMLWSAKDYSQLAPGQSVDVFFRVDNWPGTRRNLSSVGTYTGQLIYYGEVANSEGRGGHSDLGNIFGPMVTIRLGWFGTSVVL